MSKVEVNTQKQAKGLGARHVYETLKKEILTLALEPGSPLDETSISQRFAMSRSPVREALVRLSADGLVEMLSNRSTLVAPINLAEFPRYVEALDFLQRINTRLAARYATATDIKKMRALAKAFDDACRANDYLAMSATNRDFHMSIANAGRNLYLARSYGQLLDEGRRILHMHFDYIRRSDTDALLNPEHYEMVGAIEKRDIALADRLAHEHTRQFHNRFMEFLRARYDDDFEFELDTPISVPEE
ncbi:GntR family transcriptional regulator [Salipiger bermudensis]|uniref:GntR family transcriptional regulator n=1 Tax=Salipiger bermudensis TaxID=344736 RepID=UPI001CD6B6B4|nr:GntR family transcriptional regulator [Salipiger bermudensis]MCA0961782.1 GntR family transcriptional regulator [Salipiger bermudensis]